VGLGLPAAGFRDRLDENGNVNLLGDLVHSAPTFVGITNFHYPDDWGVIGVSEPEDSSYYSSFVAWQQLQNSGSGRTPLVYVGANDGMLHAFNADTGVEAFSYVPNQVFSNLLDLVDPNRAHQFYVDGSPTTVDAYINSSWKTVLVSGLRSGGQGLFALDITDPSTFATEASAKSKVMWEFTDSDTDSVSTTNANFDSDLGYTFGQPSIVRMHNGKWAAIFGNGYNNTVDNEGDGASGDSTTGNAVLYIVDLETGDLIKKIDTGEGSADDLTGNNYPNGLTEPAVVDIDGDSIVDYAYAGDLLGNLWKFDLTSTTASSWAVAYGQPFYSACSSTTCTAATFQPITSRPQVGLHPVSGLIIYFGTGKYFETGDNNSVGQNNQTFYGIWDENNVTHTPFDRSNLLEQTILLEVGQFGQEERASTDLDINWASHKGWFMDLYNHEAGNTNNYGERQVSSSVLRNGRIIFTTLIPQENDPCSAGGTSWFMEIDAISGARLPYTPFDLNDDGEFNELDYIEVDIDGDGVKEKIPASGKKSKVGILPTPGIVSSADGKIEYKYESGSSGVIEIIVENPGENSPGRQSWRHLEN
jgi:type IV pilus assembly protein PilY1